MLIILDIGSTKLKAVCLNKDYSVAKMWTDKGFNFKHEKGFSLNLKPLNEEQIKAVTSIKLFGAGLNDTEIKNELQTSISKQFPSLESFEADADLNAVLQSFYSTEDQIIGIVGTGSHFNLVNKNQLLSNVVSGGYLLSDEGSGYDIGKTICQKYIHRDFLTREDHYSFLMSYQLAPDKLVKQIYEHKSPKTYIASFAEFLHICTSQTKDQILTHCFNKLAKKIIRSIPDAKQYKCNFVGSIAYHFKPTFVKVLEKEGLQMGQIEVSPIKRLIEKYKNND